MLQDQFKIIFEEKNFGEKLFFSTAGRKKFSAGSSGPQAARRARRGGQNSQKRNNWDF